MPGFNYWISPRTVSAVAIGEEISALFNPIVVVTQAEMEIRCDMRADFVTHAQGSFISF